MARFMNNHFQQSEAMYNAEKVFEEISKEYEQLTGRDYRILIYIKWKMLKWLYLC